MLLRMRKPQTDPNVSYGPKTIYQRKEDARLWAEFETEAEKQGVSFSQALASAARLYVTDRLRSRKAHLSS